MPEPYLGEIRMFAGSFAPKHWALCDGQLLQIGSHSALYSLLGTRYGGDGQGSFALPDLRGRLAIAQGKGPGLTNRKNGEKGGAESVTLTQSQLPSHSHSFNAITTKGTSSSPQGKVTAYGEGINFYGSGTQDVSMAPASLKNTGGSNAHTNLMPSLCVNFIISLTGIFPSPV